MIGSNPALYYSNDEIFRTQHPNWLFFRLIVECPNHEDENMANSNHSQWDSHPDIGPQPACTGADLDNETGFWERHRPIDPFIEQKESDSVDDQQE
ncbi:hypothetical protein CWE25_05135 [Idiomarina fontislapidosi]|uniref:Uncharacterized protein n=2 Tax=Idiomarina fontislapidosi TaxID=263723 RepID=A0A432Y803_9GAMM|nr:hypothetical protein CWE25_05135 [Idiomarina fontislapidosi]|tara:strand:- start:793 stop:1080 length:288 start_codon:yes stop_codon:yes gene_type:complete